MRSLSPGLEYVEELITLVPRSADDLHSRAERHRDRGRRDGGKDRVKRVWPGCYEVVERWGSSGAARRSERFVNGFRCFSVCRHSSNTMTLSFEDIEGQRGRVTDGLEVDYTGKWEEEVAECVARVESNHRSNGAGIQHTEVYSRLVLELPTIAPIVEVERTDDAYPTT